MIDLKEFADKIKDQLNRIDDEEYYDDFTTLLVDNDWFGVKPILQDEIVYVEEEEFEPHMKHILFYLSNEPREVKRAKVNSVFYVKFNDTSDKLIAFSKDVRVPDSYINSIIDFFLMYLEKDIAISSNTEITNMLKIAFQELPKYECDILTLFLSWCKSNYRTKYTQDYRMNARSEKTDEAYEFEEYLEMMYYLFNEDYIIDSNMIYKAAESKNFVDTWLFLSLHFVCALRNTDLVRIYHPTLPYPPEEILQQVKDYEFEDETALYVLNTILWRLNVLPLKPNKTKRAQDITDIKLHIPESLQVLFGTLFAIAEAHFQLEGLDPDEPLIRVITTYEQIAQYMGEEIGVLFIENNFKSRSATKSYLQSIFMLADDILEEDDEYNVKGYMLAALARSHKGSFGEFAHTTATYIKDAKLSGLSAEYVAKELFERGVLSFIPSMALKIITDGEYNKLSVSNQTKLIQELNMTPREIEKAVTISEQTQKRSEKIVHELINRNDKEDVLKILHRIGNGTAVSKQSECLCLITAMNKFCPYSDRSNCIGCPYEISTKSTVFLLVSEYNRLRALYISTEQNLLKEKYKALIQTMILPALDEVLTCVAETGGADAIKELEYIIKENTNG